MQEYGYEVKSCKITFFDGDVLELQDISMRVKEKETPDGSDENRTSDQEKFLKNKLEEVYKIPEGNINISIQG